MATMWPCTDFLELLGITHPIVQAPMSGFTTPALAAAVCNAGGLGSIGCATLLASAIREQVAAIRQTTNRPFNLNFFAHAPSASTSEAAGRIRSQLAQYFAEFGLGPVPEPRETFPSVDEERLGLALDSARASSAFTSACLPPQRSGGSRKRTASP
jgi:nitronate monooxygenase